MRRVTIDIAERRVLVDDRPAGLRPKSFDLLALLASRPGHLFPRDLLIDRVWRGRAVSPDVLSGCIREIRQALGDSARAPVWIETVSGAGYRLLQTPEVRHARAPDAIAAPVSEGASGMAAQPEGPASVAVLAFAPAAADLAPVAQALSRDISVGLARTRWLRVAASASVENLPAGTAPAAAARRLGVDYLLDGDLRADGAGFALQITLVEARSDRILWADRIARAGPDMTELMDQACNQVVAAVETEIEAAEQRRARLSPVRGLDAWIGFHRGMSLLRRQDVTALEDADQTLRSAARADPACARIAAARSWHCWQQLFFGQAADRDGALARARDFAQEGIALDSRDPLGYWALGRTEWLSGEMEAAAANLGRAVALNPSFAIGHYGLGISYFMLGRDAEATAACDAAIRLSPLDPLAFAFHCVRSQLACFAEDFEGARHHARQAADHPNVHAFGVALAAWVFEIAGDRASATDCIARIRRRWPDYRRANYARAMFHQTSWYPEARRRAIDQAFDRLGF